MAKTGKVETVLSNDGKTRLKGNVGSHSTLVTQAKAPTTNINKVKIQGKQEAKDKNILETETKVSLSVLISQAKIKEKVLRSELLSAQREWFKQDELHGKELNYFKMECSEADDRYDRVQNEATAKLVEDANQALEDAINSNPLLAPSYSRFKQKRQEHDDIELEIEQLEKQQQ